jgi:hypothetical protein
MLVMCLATVLDLHASARRESQLAAAISIRADLKDVGAPQKEPIALAHPVTAKPEARVTGREAASRSTKRFRVYTKQQVQALIRRHASAYGLDPSLPLAIAECESGFRWDAANRTSSARGVFQYLSGTWRGTPEGRKGTSVLDTEAHIRTAVAQIATIGTGPWKASRHCWAVLMSETESQEALETDGEHQDVSESEPQVQQVSEES